MALPQDLPPSDPHNSPSSPSLLQILWTRKALILLGAFVGAAIGALYYAQRKPVYESTAQVLVVKKLPEVGPGFESYVEDYLATQIFILKSPAVITQAVKNGELDKLRSFQGQGDPTGTIRGSLLINREAAQTSGYSGPSILNLSYRGSDPEDCAQILATLIDSYKKFLDVSYRNTSQDSFEKLTKMNNQLEEQLKKSRQEYNEVRKGGPILIGTEGTTVNELSLKTLQTRISDLQIRRTELESRLSSIEQALKEGRDPSLLIDASEAAKPLRALTAPGGATATALSDAAIEEKLMPFRVEEKELLQRLGPDHIDVRTMHNRIEIMRDVWKGTAANTARLSPARSATTRAVLDSGVGAFGLLASPFNQGPLVSTGMLFTNRSASPEVTLYVMNLQAQLNDARVVEESLKVLATKESSNISNLTDFRDRESGLREELVRTNGLLNSIRQKLLETKAVRETGGYEARVIAEPGVGYQIEPKPAPIFTVALLLGLAAGIALAWVAEATDKSFRTPDEVRRRLGLAVVGHVPRITPDADAVIQHEAGVLTIDPSICAFYQSKSLEAEAFRGIRTTLYFSAQNEDCKIIQVTSPNMGDGKTTLATNLAVSIAQSGKKILLIDADFRRPRLHRMFGLRARHGLASVIQEEAELVEVIQATLVPNLSILPCGPRPSNPAELLTSPRFKEALETLRDKFDIILIDTPPLLAVSDPSVVASQVDGVLIALRVSKNGRPAAERARDILVSLGAKIVGVIVNGIGNRSQEGYGAAHYGYQYQYQYAYEPSDNRSYYQDGDPESAVHKNGELPPNDLEHALVNGDAEPLDPDAVDIGTLPVKSQALRPRERVPGTRRKTPDKPPGVVSGLKCWLRATLWH